MKSTLQFSHPRRPGQKSFTAALAWWLSTQGLNPDYEAAIGLVFSHGKHEYRFVGKSVDPVRYPIKAIRGADCERCHLPLEVWQELELLVLLRCKLTG